MHDFVMTVGTEWIDKYGMRQLHTLNVGSQNVNGSLTTDFESCWGIDIQDGDGVDEITDLQSYYNPLATERERFEAIVCTEMLEHDIKFWETLPLMGEALREGGLLLLSARGCRPNGEAMFEHSYPYDYWRFMPQAVEELFKLAQCEILEREEDTQHPGFIALGKRLPRKKTVGRMPVYNPRPLGGTGSWGDAL